MMDVLTTRAAKEYEYVTRIITALSPAPSKDILVSKESTLSFPSVACYTNQSPEEGPIEANLMVKSFRFDPIPGRPF